MGLHMLPNLKFLVCGILFFVLLFVAAGAGVVLPDARTRVGEMPEIGRPMMQGSMAGGQAEAQIFMMAAARRSDDPERTAEPAPADTPAPDAAKPDLSKSDLTRPELSKPDLPSPDAVFEETSDGVRLAGPAAAGSSGAGGAATAAAPAQILIVSTLPAPPAETSAGGRVEEAGPPQVVALALAAGEDRAPGHRLNVPLPPPRPPFFHALRRHVRMFHRRHRIVQQQDTAVQGVAAGQGAAPASLSPR
jgi:hypothetical protein